MDMITLIKFKCRRNEDLIKLKRCLYKPKNINLDIIEIPEARRNKISKVRKEMESNCVLTDFLFEGQTYEQRSKSIEEYLNIKYKRPESKYFHSPDKIDQYRFISEKEWKDTYKLLRSSIKQDWKYSEDENKEYLLLTVPCYPDFIISILRKDFKDLDIDIQYIIMVSDSENCNLQYITPGRIVTDNSFNYEGYYYEEDNIYHRSIVSCILKEFGIEQ